MDEVENQADGPSRPRSMLPKSTNTKAFSKPMDLLSEYNRHEAGGQYAVFAETHASAVSQAAQNKAATMPTLSKVQPGASMRPPADSRQTSKPDSAKIGHIPRQASASRKSSRDSTTNRLYPSQNLRDLSQHRPHVRTSSGGSDLQSNGKGPYHGRSLSQQVRPTATSDTLHSKAFLQRESSFRNPKAASSATQQQSSSRKNVQADSPTLSSSQPTRKDAIPSADVFHLQMELAQLHLLHRSALSVQVQWRKSAKDSFEHQFDALYERHIELKEVAHQQQALINQLSLVRWSQGRSGAQIVEKVQLLSHNVSDICNLLDSGGKYTHILETFESWFALALRVRGQRESNGQNLSRDPNFIEGIGDGWKAEAMVLERELTYIARDFESFGENSSTSSLCRLLSTYKKLVVALLEELDLIQWIENEIMTQEEVWIESTNQNVASNVSEDIGSMIPDRKAV